MNRHVKIILQEKQLTVLNRGHELCCFPIATARYEWTPKYWSNDYCNVLGQYKVAGIFSQGTPMLEQMNAHYVPWHLSPTAGNPYEDAGTGVYGVGMITLDYPNRRDLERYEKARNNGDLQKAWYNFCENHLKLIYKYFSKNKRIPFEEVRVETDYGNRTYPDLIETFPIQDPKVAFQLGVAIHGTNDAACIGTPITAGCIRMHNDTILKLISMMEIGTGVIIEEYCFYSM